MPVRFLDRKMGCECSHFLPGESGMNGLVCGAPVERGGGWCARHLRDVYPPQLPARAPWGAYDANVERTANEDREPDLTEMFK